MPPSTTYAYPRIIARVDSYRVRIAMARDIETDTTLSFRAGRISKSVPLVVHLLVNGVDHPDPLGVANAGIPVDSKRSR